jgi:hypothetical protein
LATLVLKRRRKETTPRPQTKTMKKIVRMAIMKKIKIMLKAKMMKRL